MTNKLKLIEDIYGTKRWLLNGQLHRIDGPTRELANGTKQWFLNGKRHRTDGPAIEFADGRTRWFLNGKPATAPEDC